MRPLHTLHFHNSYMELGIKSLLRSRRLRNKINKLFLHGEEQIKQIILTDNFSLEIAQKYRDSDVRIILFGSEIETLIAVSSDPRVMSWYEVFCDRDIVYKRLSVMPSVVSSLTMSETLILNRLADGDTPKAIAKDLNISERNVSALKISGMNKLGLRRTLDLLSWVKFNRAQDNLVNIR